MIRQKYHTSSAMCDQHGESVLLGALRCGTHEIARPGRVGQGRAVDAWPGRAGQGLAGVWYRRGLVGRGKCPGRVRAGYRGAVAIKPSPFLFYFHQRQPTYQARPSRASQVMSAASMLSVWKTRPSPRVTKSESAQRADDDRHGERMPPRQIAHRPWRSDPEKAPRVLAGGKSQKAGQGGY
jgi:hypothetical protein